MAKNSSNTSKLILWFLVGSLVGVSILATDMFPGLDDFSLIDWINGDKKDDDKDD